MWMSALGGKHVKAVVSMLFMRASCSSYALSSIDMSFHRPYVAGISGGSSGTYSIALSGGYEDDVDLGYALYVDIQTLLPL